MNSSIGIVLLLVCGLILSRVITVAKQWHRARTHGFALPPSRRSKHLLFGVDILRQILRDMKDGRRVKEMVNVLRLNNRTVQSRILGRRVLWTMEPANAQAIFATDFKSWQMGAGREKPMLALMGRGILMSDGATWSDSRALIKPTFNRSHIADREMFELHVGRFLKLLPQDEKTVDLAPLFNRLIMDAGSEFIFGQRLDTLLPGGSAAGQDFTEAFHYAQESLMTRSFAGPFTWIYDILYRDPKTWESCRRVREFVNLSLDKAIQAKKLSTQAESAENTTKSKYMLAEELADRSSDREWLIDQLIQVFLGAHDTPAITLTNAIFLFARNPTDWSKLRVEIQGLNIDDLTFERLKGLKYLQWTIKEVLRLHPPAPTTIRECARATTLPSGGGTDGTKPIAVEKGTKIHVCIAGIHRNREVYGDDADEFRPERWEKLKTTWEYIPFLGGPRTCPAQQLGLFWVGYALVRIAMCFKEIQNRDEVLHFVEEQRLTSSCRNGAKVGLVRV